MIGKKVTFRVNETSDKQFELQKFLIRRGGSSIDFFRLKRNDQLPPAEQFLCALLANDRDCARGIVEKKTLKNWQADFLELVEINGMGTLAYELIYGLQLADAISGQREIDRGSQPYIGSEQQEEKSVAAAQSHQQGIIEGLQNLFKVETVTFERFDAQFLRLLDHLSQFSTRVIWYKGIALSRSLYSETQHRLSSDFDFIVEPEQVTELLAVLNQFGYDQIENDSGFCNQLGVGPTFRPEDLFLVPCEQFVPSAALGLSRQGWPIVDVKFNPLDRGLKMIELSRFYEECISITYKGRSFLTPSHVDHLLISLVHFEKDRFDGWKWLLDIHLLVEQLNDAPGLWDEFVRRCIAEGVQAAAWGGLSLVKERLNSTIPDSVLQKITPGNRGMIARATLYTINPLFYWNTSSLPMLLLNAAISDDKDRKLSALRAALLPDSGFLSRYYRHGAPVGVFALLPCLIIHWLTLLVPGGVVRRTFGPFLWGRVKRATHQQP